MLDKPDAAVKELIGGILAGAANVTSGYPFDTVKVRLQSSPDLYSGTSQCARHIVKHEGTRALYRGLTPPLIGGAAETGVNYLVYSRMLDALKAPDQPSVPLHRAAAAAAVAGVALSFILGPTELIKCRMQAVGHNFEGPLHCIRHTIKSEGLRGLTRGLWATLLREVPGNTIFFTVYEGLKRSFPGMKEHENLAGRELTLWQHVLGTTSAILCGGAAGSVMWTSVLPLDVAKTRIQTALPGSSWDVGVARHLVMLWKEGGIRRLWAGLTPTLARAFPANAAQWLVWEIAMQGMKDM